jgi:hypothetical protein
MSPRTDRENTNGGELLRQEALFRIIGLYLPLARNAVLRVTAGGASLASAHTRPD